MAIQLNFMWGQTVIFRKVLGENPLFPGQTEVAEPLIKQGFHKLWNLKDNLRYDWTDFTKF